MTCPTVTLAELAVLTGRSEAWWRRHWLDMHRRHGFPRRLPGLWAWPRGAVMAWTAGGGASPMVAAANANDPVIHDASAALERRFGLFTAQQQESMT